MKRQLLRWPDISAPHPDAPFTPLLARFAWMAGIWVVSVMALGLIALLLRWILRV